MKHLFLYLLISSPLIADTHFDHAKIAVAPLETDLGLKLELFDIVESPKHRQFVAKFEGKGYFSMPEARDLLIQSIEKLDIKLSDLMNSDVQIHFKGNDGSLPPPKSVAFIRLKNGKLSYAVMQQNGDMEIRKRETLAEAYRFNDRDRHLAHKE